MTAPQTGSPVGLPVLAGEPHPLAGDPTVLHPAEVPALIAGAPVFDTEAGRAGHILDTTGFGVAGRKYVWLRPVGDTGLGGEWLALARCLRSTPP